MIGQRHALIEGIATKRNDRELGIVQLQSANNAPPLLKRRGVVENYDIDAERGDIKSIEILASSEDGDHVIARCLQ